MATHYGTQMTKLMVTRTPAEVGDVGGRVRSFIETVALNGQAINDIIYVARLPVNARIIGIYLNSSVTLGLSEVEVGIPGTASKYRAAATLTTPNEWVACELNGVVGVALAEKEDIILTNLVAALPGAGTLKILVKYTID